MGGLGYDDGFSSMDDSTLGYIPAQPPPPPPTGITFVNSQKGSGFLNSPGSVSAAALNTTTGNTMVVAIYDADASGDPAYVVTDTAGNTYTRQIFIQNTSFHLNVSIYTSFNVTGNASNVVKGTTASGTGQVGITVIQFNGGTSVDLTFSSTLVSASSLTSNSFTPTNTGDAVVFCVQANTNFTWSSGGSYAIPTNGAINDSGVGMFAANEYLIGVTTSAQTVTMNYSSTSALYGAGIAIHP